MKNVQAAKPRNGFRQGGFDAGPLAHVAMDEMGVAAGILGARAGGLRGRLPAHDVDFGDDDLGALFGKALRGGAADAAATARDECHFPGQSRHDDEDIGR